MATKWIIHGTGLHIDGLASACFFMLFCKRPFALVELYDGQAEAARRVKARHASNWHPDSLLHQDDPGLPHYKGWNSLENLQ
jgi:hypothetical protein